MPAKPTVEEQINALYNAVPASGEIAYTALSANLIAAGNKDALNHVFTLKHEGRIKMRTVVNPDTHEKGTFISRA